MPKVKYYGKGVNGEESDIDIKKEKNKKPIWKWIIGGILIVIIIIFVVLFAKSASTVASSTADAAGSGISSAINTATNVVDTGMDAAGVAGGLYIANWAFGDYLKEFGTDLYTSIHNVIYGTESASTAVADASSSATDVAGDATTAIGGAAEGGAMLEDAADVAELAI